MNSICTGIDQPAISDAETGDQSPPSSELHPQPRIRSNP